MMANTETSGDDATEEWSTPVNWKDPANQGRMEKKLNIWSFPLKQAHL